MQYGSVCSGIEATSRAAPPGWSPAFFAEIDPFCSAYLAHHYPGVPNHGDFTSLLGRSPEPIDMLVGGTPCQAFSTAGLRGGIADARGNLALAFVRLVAHYRPRWILWENVPGVLSSGRGRDLGSFLGALGDVGYGWAYRVLDARGFGLPQRRRRVFVVGRAGGLAERAAEVLLDDAGDGWNPPARCLPGRETSSGPGGRLARGVVAFDYKQHGADATRECSPTLRATPHAQSHANGGGHVAVAAPGLPVRRLTPCECERLQGFPDDATLVPFRGKLAADYVRYRAIGNSMAVPVMATILERIARVDAA